MWRHVRCLAPLARSKLGNLGIHALDLGVQLRPAQPGQLTTPEPARPALDGVKCLCGLDFVAWRCAFCLHNRAQDRGRVCRLNRPRPLSLR